MFLNIIYYKSLDIKIIINLKIVMKTLLIQIYCDMEG